VPNFINLVKLKPVFFGDEVDFFFNCRSAQCNLLLKLSREFFIVELESVTCVLIALVALIIVANFLEVHRKRMTLSLLLEDFLG
jgi:hypothetical protein